MFFFFFISLFWSRFFELFAKYDGYKDGHVKLKKPKQLQEVLDIARGLLAEIEQNRADPETEEKKGKLEQLKSVLEMWVCPESHKHGLTWARSSWFDVACSICYCLVLLYIYMLCV